MALERWQKSDPITALRLNGMRSAILRNAANIGTGNRRYGGFAPDSCLSVKLANTLERDIEFGEVIGLGEQYLTDNQNHPKTILIETEEIDTEKHVGSFAIAGEKIADGGVGLGHYLGICMARVNVSDADHWYATIEDESKILVSAWLGRAKILWKKNAASTGEMLAVIQIGDGAMPVRIKAVADPADGMISVKLADAEGNVIGDAFEIFNGEED
jgi:hypothetical protein